VQWAGDERSVRLDVQDVVASSVPALRYVG
jgi:hypothetical protein